MYKIKIIIVGRLKKNYWQQALAHYQKMMRAMLKIEMVVVKEVGQGSVQERKRLEGMQILKKINTQDRIIALHERGQSFDSLQFAKFLGQNLDQPGQRCAFVVGGALGLAPQVLEAAHTQLSLSPLTMPHELALVVLYEQLFRATTIIQNRTYHY